MIQFGKYCGQQRNKIICRVTNETQHSFLGEFMGRRTCSAETRRIRCKSGCLVYLYVMWNCITFLDIRDHLEFHFPFQLMNSWAGLEAAAGSQVDAHKILTEQAGFGSYEDSEVGWYIWETVFFDSTNKVINKREATQLVSTKWTDSFSSLLYLNHVITPSFSQKSCAFPQE